VSRRAGFLFLALAMISVSSPEARAEKINYSPKLSFRVSNGIIQNIGANAGTAASIGALDLGFLYYLSGTVSLGLGYRADFDLKNTNLPLTSLDFSSRFYFSGQGTHSTQYYPTITSERHDNRVWYTGIGISQRSYFLAKQNTRTNISGTLTDTPTTNTSSLSGTSVGLTGLFGTDIRISRHFEFTAEVNLGLLSFSSSDQKIRIQGYLFNTGINFVW